MYKKNHEPNIEKPEKSRTFRHEDEKIEKTDKNKILLLEAQKIASQVYKDGIKEIYKLTVDALKKNDSYETDKYISSLSHISNIITTAAKHQPYQQPQQLQQQPLQPLHQSSDSSKIFCLYCYGPHWLVNCHQIPPKYRGSCIKCWKSTRHQAKDCKSNRQKEPWR
ncbi:hypothetical protein RhiirA5_440177 [Rhizophagus irregularis]|uniref:Uncharacterized protein n=2 Tax=Rhizophagus irregularis TaxID=588596 RepID=A0A2N0NGX9_9GLOM|nr:hypothetical protein RhiirA5_440177 [Rhizophagus irregularis]